MKKNILLLLFSVICLKAFTQVPTITPLQTDAQCPGVNITFSASIPGAKNIISVTATALNVPPLVVQQPYNISFSNGTATFNFVGRFADNNNKQTFTVNYTDVNNLSQSINFTYVKIKSLLTANIFSQISPTPKSITAQRCQTQNFNISFANVQYGNPWENPQIGYGTVTDYEYLLPANWKLGNTPSTGTNWIPAGNSVTVTSDLSTGDGGSIRIRPSNIACATGLVTGQEAIIPISRPAPTMSITPSGNQAFICSGSKTFTLVGLPANATVTSWSSSNTSLATVPPNSTGASVSVTKVGGDGTVVLTANVSQCSYTYQVPLTINLGTFISGYYNVSGDYVSSNNNQFLYFSTPPSAYAYAYSPQNQVILFDCHVSQTFVSNLTWSISGTYSLFYPNSGGFTLYMFTPNTSISYARNTATVTLTGNSTCGSLNKTYTIDAIVNTYYYAMTVSPNPINQNSISLKISKVPDTASSKAPNIQNKPLVADNGSKGITVLYLYDFYTGRLIKQWRFEEIEASNYNLNITGVKGGVYLLKLNRDNKSTSTKIIVQH